MLRFKGCKNGVKSFLGCCAVAGQGMEQSDFSDVDELHQHQQSELLGLLRCSKQSLSTRIDSVNLRLLFHFYPRTRIASRNTTHSDLRARYLTLFPLIIDNTPRR